MWSRHPKRSFSSNSDSGDSSSISSSSSSISSSSSSSSRNNSSSCCFSNKSISKYVIKQSNETILPYRSKVTVTYEIRWANMGSNTLLDEYHLHNQLNISSTHRCGTPLSVSLTPRVGYPAHFSDAVSVSVFPPRPLRAAVSVSFAAA